MNIVGRTVFLIVAFGIFCHYTDALDASSGHHGIQIVTLSDHTFELKIDDLKRVLEASEVRDRHAVVVSIAGAYREGKSFLLNFFLRYLYAKYKSHNVEGWLHGHGNNSELNGFKWRGGHNRETTGIWMWSDIFTYDFANGEKVAIILLDTQGIFDDQTSLNECTLIFGLSTLMSSIQCYNIMQGVQENHLQNLQLFTEYGRLATSQMNVKPFQELLFIVRDWQYEDEEPYGWSQRAIDSTFEETIDQTHDMHELRRQIKSSFEKIRAFLMPFPGDAVAENDNFRGELQEIDEQFRNMLLKLVPALFSPENLVIKKINGEKVRARDLVKYFKTYLDSFNNIGLLDAPTAFNATAQAYYEILCDECLGTYNTSMHNSLDKCESYLTDTELVELHKKQKNYSIVQFQLKPQFGGSSTAMNFQTKLEFDINYMFNMFTLKNEYKRTLYVAKANRANGILIDSIYSEFEKQMNEHIELQPVQNLSADSLNSDFSDCKDGALKKFDAQKMGSIDVYTSSLDKLKSYVDNYEAKFKQAIEEYQKGVGSYSDSLQNIIAIENGYFEYSELVTHHETAKNEAVKQFRQKFSQQIDELTLIVKLKLISGIEKKFHEFIEQNDEKRNKIIKDEDERRHKEEEQLRLNRERDEKIRHDEKKKKEDRENNIFDNDTEMEEIISNFEIEELEHLERAKESYVEEIELLKAINIKRGEASRTLRRKLKGDGEIKNLSMNKFEQRANNMESRIKETNRQKKATYEYEKQMAIYNNAPTSIAKPSVTILIIIAVTSCFSSLSKLLSPLA